MTSYAHFRISPKKQMPVIRGWRSGRFYEICFIINKILCIQGHHRGPFSMIPTGLTRVFVVHRTFIHPIGTDVRPSPHLRGRTRR